MRNLWIAVALVPVLALTANAQVRVDVGEGGVKVDTPAGRVVGAADASRASFRSSKLVGMNVKNSKNQDLGKIEDLVIDERGHVRYAAISFGGFLGFNNKYFAVPWRSLKVKHDSGSDSHFVELNVTKEYLDAAVGFPSDNWPDFADPKMNEKIDAYWLREETKTTLPPTTQPRP
jgi:sporulation protein YlmC with PRC-barrel domain